MSFFNPSIHLPPLPDLPSSDRPSYPSASSSQKSKPRASCTNCRRNHKRCGDVRPCATCVATGKADSCFESSMSGYSAAGHQESSMHLDDAFRQPLPPPASMYPTPDSLFQTTPSSASFGSSSSRTGSFDSGYHSFPDAPLSGRPNLSVKDLPPLPPLPRNPTSSSVTFVLGTDMRIGRVSDESLKLLGYHSHEMVTQNLSFYLQAADRPRLGMLALQLLQCPFAPGCPCPATPVELQRCSMSALTNSIPGVSSVFGTLKLRTYTKAYLSCSLELYLGSYFGGSFSDPRRAVIILKATPVSSQGSAASSTSFLDAPAPSTSIPSKFSTAPRSNVRQGRPPVSSREKFGPIADFSIPTMPGVDFSGVPSTTGRKRGNSIMDYSYDSGNMGRATPSPRDSISSSEGGGTFGSSSASSYSDLSGFSGLGMDLPPLPPSSIGRRPSFATGSGRSLNSKRSGDLPSLQRRSASDMDLGTETAAYPPSRDTRRPSILSSDPFDRHTWPQYKRRPSSSSASIQDTGHFFSKPKTLPSIASWAPEPLQYFPKRQDPQYDGGARQARNAPYGSLGGPRRGSLF